MVNPSDHERPWGIKESASYNEEAPPPRCVHEYDYICSSGRIVNRCNNLRQQGGTANGHRNVEVRCTSAKPCFQSVRGDPEQYPRHEFCCQYCGDVCNLCNRSMEDSRYCIRCHTAKEEGDQVAHKIHIAESRDITQCFGNNMKNYILNEQERSWKKYPHTIPDHLELRMHDIDHYILM